MRSWTIGFLVLPILALNASAGALNSAVNFAVLGASTVTNTGNTTIYGNLGVSPGTAITGFGPGIVIGTTDAGDAAAAQAQTDVASAYNYFAGLPETQDLSNQNLGGLTLTPGVYFFSSSAQLTGILTLDAQGSDTAFWVFQIGSTLTTASNSSVQVINGRPDDGLYWQVGSSATLGTGTAFAGNILANTSITLNTGATINCGRALAETGAVTLDTNNVSIGCTAGSPGSGDGGGFAGSNVPEPASFLLLFSGLAIVVARRRFQSVSKPGRSITAA